MIIYKYQYSFAFARILNFYSIRALWSSNFKYSIFNSFKCYCCKLNS